MKFACAIHWPSLMRGCMWNYSLLGMSILNAKYDRSLMNEMVVNGCIRHCRFV